MIPDIEILDNRIDDILKSNTYKKKSKRKGYLDRFLALENIW